MALISTSRITGAAPGGGGGGTGVETEWIIEETTITYAVTPPATYFFFPLLNEPKSNSETVWMDGLVLHPTDYVYMNFGGGIQGIRLLFALDPAFSADGVAYKLTVRYEYEI
jgi:hypothetical protein